MSRAAARASTRFATRVEAAPPTPSATDAALAVPTASAAAFSALTRREPGFGSSLLRAGCCASLAIIAARTSVDPEFGPLVRPGGGGAAAPRVRPGGGGPGGGGGFAAPGGPRRPGGPRGGCGGGGAPRGGGGFFPNSLRICSTVVWQPVDSIAHNLNFVLESSSLDIAIEGRFLDHWIRAENASKNTRDSNE